MKKTRVKKTLPKDRKGKKMVSYTKVGPLQGLGPSCQHMQWKYGDHIL